jgi:hypothetical protein
MGNNLLFAARVFEVTSCWWVVAIFAGVVVGLAFMVIVANAIVDHPTGRG